MSLADGPDSGSFDNVTPGPAQGETLIDPVTGNPEIQSSGDVQGNQSDDVGSGNVQPQQQTASDDDLIYDPAEYDRVTSGLDPEIKRQVDAFRKSLQGDYTRKTQKVAEVRKMADAYQQFLRDPHGTLHEVAKQLGYQVNPMNGSGNQQQSASNMDDFAPQTWGEVMTKLKESVMAELTPHLNEQVSPLLNEMQSIKQQEFESKLNDIDPMWHQYQDDIMQNLRQYPSLMADPKKLYMMSVPTKVFESRMTQNALNRVKKSTSSNSPFSGSQTTKRPGKNMSPNKLMSFQEAVEYAKAQLKGH